MAYKAAMTHLSQLICDGWTSNMLEPFDSDHTDAYFFVL